MNMKFGSVCSGIEAASMAWNQLGWEASWLAEIEPFPSAVLKHRYPDTPNYGDMTKLPEMVLNGEIEAPDVLVGGTPCQSFSVAGAREGLSDERGQLTIKYVELANAIDTIRRRDGKDECIIVWENVPGVLSSKDNAFGCFIAALAGGSSEARSPRGGRWPNAGYVLGPQRAVAWRILDAQYFGLAQRRKRVFVVASAREDFSPAEVLFEFDGVRRDTPPSREQGQKTTGNVGAGFTPSSFGGYRAGVGTLRANGGDLGEGSETLVTHDKVKWPAEIASTLNASLVRRQDLVSGDVFGALDTCSPQGQAVIYPINTQIALRHKKLGERTGLGIGADGDPAYTLQASHSHAIAIQGSVIGRKPDNGPQGPGYDDSGVRFTQTAVDRHAVAIAGTQNDYFRDATDNLAPTLRSGSGGGVVNQAVATATAVRRLTPVECERLQGFPDCYTMIPWRNKPAVECPDGHRYKALGNSMAVPVMRWIGERISAHLA